MRMCFPMTLSFGLGFRLGGSALDAHRGSSLVFLPTEDQEVSLTPEQTFAIRMIGRRFLASAPETFSGHLSAASLPTDSSICENSSNEMLTQKWYFLRLVEKSPRVLC